ncbi:hypothetical protein L1280_002305 [Deinococcus sp. HSC-46F16]|uniref:hypothetical protein n=1 Tax=Deinococcus sp. HSC-46F16 TaxID=2910968 RepID=UPI00209E652A|nr:hypothetical protein [Deinococcus sp. HSC-46F16]MCP2015144.1 hypothetical protein [Deinococcus sp. HSC-46F16]
MRRLLALAALLLPTVHAAPSVRAPNLAVLNQGQILCYDAIVEIDRKEDAAKVGRAEEQIAAALKGLGLRAQEFDAAERCHRVLSFTFEMDNVGAPMLYKASLELQSLMAYDGDVNTNIVTVWEAEHWGADRGEITPARVSSIFSEVLTEELQTFKDDYRSLASAGKRT